MNPFTLNFGIEPTSYISRNTLKDEIIHSFNANPSTSNLYMITGLRGSGKTVFLTDIEDYFRDQGWIVFDLSIETNLLQSFAAKLYNHQKLRSFFNLAKLNFSHLGIGIEINGEPPITDLSTAIERMLDVVKKKNKKILIAVDEAVNSETMRTFASTFQILLREHYPVYLLMTGLYENIYDLQNVKTLTFLYRAPKITLSPLNTTAMVVEYQRIFKNTLEEAREMANLTKGYPYAYQVTGYLCFKNGTKHITEEVLNSFDVYMDEYVYSKIWQEQSPVKRKILMAIGSSKTGRVKDIRDSLSMSSNAFSVYRQRLIRQGLIQSDGYGKVKLTLPRFEVFMDNQFFDE